MKEELYMQNAMIIDPKDNVAVAIEPIAAGDTVTYLKEGKTVSLKATEDITIYHKLATRATPMCSPYFTTGSPFSMARVASL